MIAQNEKTVRNEELLREGYAAFAAGDMVTIERQFHPNIVWHAQRLGQLGGDHVGFPAVLQFFGRSMEMTHGTFHIELLDVLSSANGAAAVVRSMGERNGKRLDDRQVHVLRIEDDQVVEAWQYVGDGKAAEEFWA